MLETQSGNVLRFITEERVEGNAFGGFDCLFIGFIPEFVSAEEIIDKPAKNSAGIAIAEDDIAPAGEAGVMMQERIIDAAILKILAKGFGC